MTRDHIKLPRSLDVESRQLEVFRDWIEQVVQPYVNAIKWEEEDCCGGGPVWYEVRTSGIGDSITAHAFHFKCELAIDDDNEIIGWKP